MYVMWEEFRNVHLLMTVWPSWGDPVRLTGRCSPFINKPLSFAAAPHPLISLRVHMLWPFHYECSVISQPWYWDIRVQLQRTYLGIAFSFKAPLLSVSLPPPPPSLPPSLPPSPRCKTKFVFEFEFSVSLWWIGVGGGGGGGIEPACFLIRNCCRPLCTSSQRSVAAWNEDGNCQLDPLKAWELGHARNRKMSEGKNPVVWLSWRTEESKQFRSWRHTKYLLHHS